MLFMKKLYGMFFLSMSFIAHASHTGDAGRLPDDFKFRPADANKRTNVIAQYESYKHNESRNKSGIANNDTPITINWQKVREKEHLAQENSSSSYCIIS